MAKNTTRRLNYKAEVEITSFGGRVRTRVRATDQIAVWSNKRQQGPTVRADGVTHRFPKSRVTKSSLSI